jgi:hypothetical protein
MLSYRGLGDEKQAREHQERYMRFKADESAQAITGKYRQLNPEDNNERQAVHEHVSVPLPVKNGTAGAPARSIAHRSNRSNSSHSRLNHSSLNHSKMIASIGASK